MEPGAADSGGNCWVFVFGVVWSFMQRGLGAVKSRILDV